ncbi:MAG TPA: endonuclease domain-containing protein [Patescibacteria group bacterium]|nr:endonuclease domain-containing protein [Patescibacteria group bacterium]
MKIFNRRDRKDFRRENRREMNDVEVTLWNHLRNGQIGHKFRRQHSVGPYVVDFYCPAKRLVIEVDGDTHFEPDAVEYDLRRDEFLRSQGLGVIRFTNLEVRDNLSGVIDAVLDNISKTEAATPSNSPLERGRTGNEKV